MAYRVLEVTLHSARDLKNVNFISRMEVYAVATISGDPLTRQCTPSDPYGGRHPAWNATLRFTVAALPAPVAAKADRHMATPSPAKADWQVGTYVPAARTKGRNNGNLEFEMGLGAGLVAALPAPVAAKADRHMATPSPAKADWQVGTYVPAARTKGRNNGNLEFEMGLGAGLVGGAIGGMLASDMVSDAAVYNAGYMAGFADREHAVY
uniref:C2 domain-containing protein n=1 Tax=Oryza brachyantha TaxID=4533 RepID=J3MNY9_ORYBR